MVDAFIRETEIPAEVQEREKRWSERRMRNEQQRMNNDPRAAGREGGIVLWLCTVSQQTFWRFLDAASEVSESALTGVS